MRSIRGLLKPCYLFSPSAALRRVLLEFKPRPGAVTIVSLPWNVPIEVELADAIGGEIFKQRIFDIAVSEIAWRLSRPGSKVLDVGANIGYLTGLFAIRAGVGGEVHAFEPHPKIQETLQRNIARIGLTRRAARVSLHPCAVGEVPDSARLVETDYFRTNQGTAMVSQERNANDVRSYSVTMETLDHLFSHERFDLLKIDVEGFEPQVLRGARGLLQSKRISHIIYEDHQPRRSGVAQMLADEGYTVFSIGYGLLGPKLQGLDQDIAINQDWESPSCLATLEPDAVKRIAARRGWQSLRC
jgi:FkbM family methyltransferase